MRRAGCSLAVVGVLMCVGSLALFGTSIFRAIAAHQARVAPIAIGDSWSSGTLAVDTAKYCQVAVRGLVRSEHAERGTGDDASWNLLFAFPFRYTVYDGEGRVIHQQAKDFASDSGGHSSTNSRITDQGGSAQIEQGYDKFQVAAPGTIRVEASLGEDVDYRATIAGAQVVVYDNVSKHAARVGVGVALLVAGGGITMLGFILVIIAAARGGGQR